MSAGWLRTASEKEQKMTPAAEKPLLEGRGHRDAVEYRIDGDAGQSRPFMQGHAEFGIGLQQFRVDFLEAFSGRRSWSSERSSRRSTGSRWPGTWHAPNAVRAE